MVLTAPSTSPGPAGAHIVVGEAADKAAAGLSNLVFDDVLPTDEEDWSSSCDSDSTSPDSAWGSTPGPAPGPLPGSVETDGPGVHVEKVKLVNSTAQIGNINNYKGPVTVVVTNETNVGGAVNLPTVLSAGGGVVLCADALKQAVDYAQPLPPVMPVQTSFGPAPPTERTSLTFVKKFLRWPGVTVPVCVLAAAIGLVVVITVVLVKPDDKIIELKNGVRLATRSFWHARPPKKKPDILRTPVSLIIINHSGTKFCFDTDECRSLISDIQSYHMDDHNREWDDIGYNYMIGGDGVTYEGRGWDAVGAHLHGWNSKSLGVAIVGNFTAQTPTNEQREQLKRFIAWGLELGKVRRDYQLAGACQLQASASPGLRFMSELRTWPHWWNYTYASNACSD